MRKHKRRYQVTLVQRNEDDYTVELSGTFVVHGWANYLAVKQDIENAVEQYLI